AVLSRRVDFELKKSGFSNWKYNLPQIKKILCVSDEIRRIVQKSIERPERAVTVYSGIDQKRFENIEEKDYLKNRFHLPEDSFLVGNTSAIAGHKDYYTFVDTAKLVIDKHPGKFYFFIIGDGPMKDEIQDYVAELKLADSVIFTGFLTNIPEVLKELDLFLMTSKTEGLGTSVLDAFAVGLPVVSTAGGGLKETVIHEQTGLQANVGDAKQLADHVIELYKHPDKRKLIAAEARDFVNKFTKQNTANETLKIYKNILA
ncbi:MAG: glycosyltransferase family 4 protein, partial [Cyclobacteriaceae bacterium]